MIIYKWLTEDQSAPLGKGKWIENRWRSVKGDLVPCKNGLHFARSKELIEHISSQLWIAEIDESELIDAGDKIVVRRARIIKRVETITEWSLRAFAADCAERVVHLTGPDPRCVEAIRVARLFAMQKANEKELDAARAAWDAEGAAARAAGRDAAGAAARAVWAAWAAAGAAGDAWAAARDAAGDVARDAAWAAGATARAAGRDAAGAAAWDAEGAAAWDAEGAAARAAGRDAAGAAANARLLQYVEHGMTTMGMPWPENPAWPIA